MTYCRVFIVAAISFHALFNHAVYAAAFQFYELGTPIIGTAGVGQAALANDASTSYFNPAGMSQLQSTQFMIGSQLILPDTRFSPNNQTTIVGDNGGEAASLTPGFDLYYVYHASQKLQFGLNLTSPYGGMLTYDDGWVGRYTVQNSTFYTLDLEPAVSYQVNNSLAIGGGVTVEYANLQESVALPFKPDDDGQITIKTNNTAAGFTLGALFSPTKKTKIGLTYRSQIAHNLRGRTTFLRLTETPHTSTRLVMPQNVIASAVQEVTAKFSILGDLGWANWASMKSTILTIDGLSEKVPDDWNNTYRAGLGGQYKLTPTLLIQGGASYDSSPTDTQHRLPSLPMDRQVRIGTGVIYSYNPAIQIGLSYEYINFGKASIDNHSPLGTFSGSYSKNEANALQVSINVTC